jgi:hypothetical protein
VLGFDAPDGGIHLLPKITRQAVDRLLGQEGLGDISPHTLYKQLDEFGYIASMGEDGYLVPATLNGKTTRFLHLKRAAISEVSNVQFRVTQAHKRPLIVSPSLLRMN